MIVWHDHDTAKLTLQDRGVHSLLLPVRSPDLDPLYYGVFGTVKRAERKAHNDRAPDCDEVCTSFIARLRSLNTDSIIEELPLRLRACKESCGGHIEELLRRLKRHST
jgi:hypothetical protein